MEENLSATLDSFGRVHPHTARALNFLGKAQLQAGKPDAALRSLFDAFEIQKSILGEFHHNTLSIASNIIYIIDHHPALSSARLEDEMVMYRKILSDLANDPEADEADQA